ncbi:hypothetical protein [Leptospira sp. GIMC2001]|uniref:hypothetical protein n=1 Tax=Leptospira sp. GIMC2001 TaxID=1513297 RepID=UPI00234B6609|nr:hypothetical protein [Leptospira sp. GIMC2001]WCL51168.1 hypothetical protein O4O04_10250 [Leptospira sp. GIMC2001]
MKMDFNNKVIALCLTVLFLIGCAGHPITHKASNPIVQKELKSSSNILILTYIANKETSLSVELIGTKHNYNAEITDTESLLLNLKNSFKEKVNAKLISDAGLQSSPTYKSLESRNKVSDRDHNLNDGLLILNEEDMALVPKIAQETKADAVILLRLQNYINTMSSFNTTIDGLVLDNQGQLIYSNAIAVPGSMEDTYDDPSEGVGNKAKAVLGALSMSFNHTRTIGLQPRFVKNSKHVVDEFFTGFSSKFKIEKKK